MRIVFFGYDFFHASLLRLMDDGHEIVHIFSFDTDNRYNFNVMISGLADHYKIPFCLQPPTLSDIETLWRNQKVDLFFSAAYQYKIPIPADPHFRGLNLHPSLLPKVRGVWPLPVILYQHPEAAGLSLHKLTDKWDQGDILAQHKITVTDQDDLETLSAKCQMRAPEFISDTIHNLNELWHKATPQKNLGDASYFSYPPEAWRTLSFDKKVIDIQKTIQAFGRFEVMFFMNGQKYWAKHATCWIENHDYKTGALVCRMNRELVFACQDGFVCIKDYSVGI